MFHRGSSIWIRSIDDLSVAEDEAASLTILTAPALFGWSPPRLAIESGVELFRDFDLKIASRTSPVCGASQVGSGLARSTGIWKRMFQRVFNA